jgi:hypothetical protein
VMGVQGPTPPDPGGSLASIPTMPGEDAAVDGASPVVRRFTPVPTGVSQVRRLVADMLIRRGRPELVDRATLCATELATNAVLHARGPYEVAIRSAGSGIRVEVIDGRPDNLPMPVPRTGTAIEVTRSATTGRGLMIVAALATRWGFTASESAKSVWAEIDDSLPADGEPVVVIDPGTVAPPGPLLLALKAMPVRAAVASGVQVDELVRETQLRPELFTGPGERDRLSDLLDRSAHPRLAGRYAALRAAGLACARFDVDIATTTDAITAIDELNGLLDSLANRLESGPATTTEDVRRYRAWLAVEVAAQMDGRGPTPCVLPS